MMRMRLKDNKDSRSNLSMGKNDEGNIFSTSAIEGNGSSREHVDEEGIAQRMIPTDKV